MSYFCHIRITLLIIKVVGIVLQIAQIDTELKFISMNLLYLRENKFDSTDIYREKDLCK
jgi:hypothetical protein